MLSQKQFKALANQVAVQQSMPQEVRLVSPLASIGSKCVPTPDKQDIQVSRLSLIVKNNNKSGYMVNKIYTFVTSSYLRIVNEKRIYYKQ